MLHCLVNLLFIRYTVILARMDLKTKGALNYGIDNLQLSGKFDMINVHPLNFNWVSL